MGNHENSTFWRTKINDMAWGRARISGVEPCLAYWPSKEPGQPIPRIHSHSQPQNTNSCDHTAILLPHWFPRTAGAAPEATAQLRQHDLQSAGTMAGGMVLGCVPRGTAEVRFRLLAPETESADKTGQDWLKEQLEKHEWHSEKMSEIFKNHHETKTCEKLSIF